MKETVSLCSTAIRSQFQLFSSNRMERFNPQFDEKKSTSVKFQNTEYL